MKPTPLAATVCAGWLGVACCQAAVAETLIAHYDSFSLSKPTEPVPDGWSVWTPRAEISPRFTVDPKAGRQKLGALRIDGNRNPASFGAWRRRVVGIAGGHTYRLAAFYRTRGVLHERHCVGARLDWLGDKGQRVRQPDYALETAKDGSWTKIEAVTTAPSEARDVMIELSLGWAPKGSVWWDCIELSEESAPPTRPVTLATVYLRPQGTHSAAENVDEFCRVLATAAPLKPDLICLPEGITVVGNGKNYVEVSEPVPGPTTTRLGEVAKQLHCFIVAGLYERVEAVVYNTAVLIGRQGELVGTYRKTHLPREEVEAGITPGDTYPVFTTDFGKVGLLVCWDLQFPEPARALALQGAEIILLPIWGGSEILARARAIENHVFLASSSYDMKTFILDPTGKTLAEASTDKPVACATINLDEQIFQPWLGDMKPRTWKERRPDIPLP
jgi:predicted amidohydrolase